MSMLSREIVCITGCTRGLGRVMVEGFVEGGFTVVGRGRTSPAIQSLNEARKGEGHCFYTVDVAEEEAVKRFAEQVIEQVGVPRLLLNNAGMINRNAPLWEVPAEEFSQIIDINIKGVASIIRAFVPAMIQQGDGVIVNFSSGWGRSTAPEVAPYCATKWAVEGLSQALAQELPQGITTVALNPGIIDTDMLKSCFGEAASNSISPEAWAERAVPFITQIGPENNGQALTIR